MKQRVCATWPNCTGLGHVQHGSGPERVLVMHDWLGDHRNYEAVMPYLDGDAFTYVFVDLRGYGTSVGMRGCYTVEEIAADCLDLANRLGWQRFHLIGHSMTGLATQRIAADAPERIKSVVAVCPVSAGENDDAFRRLVKFVTGGLSDRWAEVKLQQNRQAVAPECRGGYLEMFVNADFVEDVRGLEMPYLILIGDKDPGFDEGIMKQTFPAWHPNASLQVISNCGHYPMQECPPYFATAVENFLRKAAQDDRD